jgi:hypothetical protein
MPIGHVFDGLSNGATPEGVALPSPEISLVLRWGSEPQRSIADVTLGRCPEKSSPATPLGVYFTDLGGNRVS